MIKPTFTNIVLGLLFILLVTACIKQLHNMFESFEDTSNSSMEDQYKGIRNIHNSLPKFKAKDMKVIVKSFIEGLNNIIEERPEYVNALRDVFNDPKINKALMSIIFIKNENTSAFSIAKYV
jgi:uncharacterized protein YjgD (DUF1641 family)